MLILGFLKLKVAKWDNETDGRKASTTTYVPIASSFVIGTFFRLSANFIPTFPNQLMNCLILTSMKEASVTASDCSQWHVAQQCTQNALLRLWVGERTTMLCNTWQCFYFVCVCARARLCVRVQKLPLIAWRQCRLDMIYELMYLNDTWLTLRRLMSYIYIYIYIWSTHSWCF